MGALSLGFEMVRPGRVGPGALAMPISRQRDIFDREDDDAFQGSGRPAGRLSFSLAISEGSAMKRRRINQPARWMGRAANRERGLPTVAA